MALISFQVWEASRLLVRSFILSLQQLLSVILLRVTVHLTPSLRRKLSSVQLKITEVCLPSYFSNKNYISWHDSLVHPPTPSHRVFSYICAFSHIFLCHTGSEKHLHEKGQDFLKLLILTAASKLYTANKALILFSVWW